jgi:hypothetical protein
MNSNPTADIRSLVLQHWALANARDWAQFALLLAPDLLYEVPQTRERVLGRAGYVDFFATWPVPWKVDVVKCIADEQSALTLIEFQSAEPPMTGLTIFEASGGLITKVTDYWPSAYEPTPRASSHVQRY